MIRYVHGSKDSTDLDVIYIVEEMPSFIDCQHFCKLDPTENRNIAVITDGVVTESFKGRPDEVNNALLDTYWLHTQQFPLLITRKLPRDVLLKDITVVRKLISPLTKTSMRPQIKKALHGGWSDRVAALKATCLDWPELESIPKMPKKELLKSYAFQIGQAMGLHTGVELYTKTDIAEQFPQLKPYLYREDASVEDLQNMLSDYLCILTDMNLEERPDEKLLDRRTGHLYNVFAEYRYDTLEEGT